MTTRGTLCDIFFFENDKAIEFNKILRNNGHMYTCVLNVVDLKELMRTCITWSAELGLC